MTLVAWAFAAGDAAAQAVLDVSTLTKYVDRLPNPMDNVILPTGSLNGWPLYDVSISQFQQQLHSELPPTTLWGYNGMYPGPTFDVARGAGIKVRWTNKLVDGAGAPLPHFLPYDSTLHGAAATGDHAGHGGDFPQSRTVTHLHGGVVDEMSDGYPEHWFTGDPNAAPNGLGGPAGNSLVTTYPNDQRAAGMWYHDHAMAATRLNVYAGLAGFYLNRDADEAALNLPSGDHEIPLMIQDKSFYEDGQLYYPGDPEEGGPVGHVASFVGDAHLVNGKVWPYLEVEPRKYRFRMLNAANSRAYELSLMPDGGAAVDPLTLHQIGTDGGLLASRVDRTTVQLSSSDRADVIVDFSQFQPGDTLRLFNGSLSEPDFLDEVMQFRVVPATGADTSSLPTDLVEVPRYDPADAVTTRHLRLVRGFDSMGRQRMMLDGKSWSDPVSEVVQLGELEIWEIENTTGDAHPIHLHMEAFQLLSRTSVLGNDLPLAEFELGWEDTVTIPGGETARFMVKYEKFAGQFVWHCHLLEHEDHEMMRPYRIVPEPAGWLSGATAAGVGAVAGLRARSGRALSARRRRERQR